MGMFFQTEAKASAKGRKASLPVETLYRESCRVCPLNKAKLEHPKLPAKGSKRPTVYVLGDGLSQEDDAAGRHFSGAAGKLLRNNLPDAAVRYNNVTQCGTPKDRSPAPTEIVCCRSRIVEDIERTKPDVIIAAGNLATAWVLGESASTFHWRGKVVPVQIGTHTCWALPVSSPKYVLQKAVSWGPSDEERTFVRDLNAVSEVLESPAPKVPKIDPSMVTCIYGKGKADFQKLRKILGVMRKHKKPVAIDVETHPLRPYAKTSVLVTASVSDGKETVAFPIEHANGWSRQWRPRVVKLLRWFMLGRNVKVTHNQDMEMSWLASRLGDDLFTRKVRWGDTMALAYVYDNRLGTLSLDFQCRWWLGQRVKDKGPRLDMENMHLERLEDLLPYNGVDALATILLYRKLARAVRSVDRLWSVYQSQVNRARAYAASNAAGVYVSVKRLKAHQSRVESDVAQALADVQATKDAQKFRRRFGRTFNPNKEQDLHDLFHVMLKRAEIYVDRKDKKNHKTVTKLSYDKGVLEKIGRPITRYIIAQRQADKLLSTYITPTYPLLEFDGLIHPTVNDKKLATSRSSYENPNLQNYPRRNNVWIRGHFRAPRGMWMLGYDYGQIEARVIAMLSRDKRFIHALWNHLDIHMDWTEIFLDEVPRLWDRYAKLAKSEDEGPIKKKLRDAVKNKWVFPRFFGASDDSCARYMDVPVRDAERLGNRFWEEFEGVKQWQERQKRDYRRDGYLVLPTGRRVFAPLTTNELFNYPVQGTASEIQKDAMVRIFDEFELPHTFEIHDDLTYTVHLEKVDELRPKIAERLCMTPFDFINVPLTVECKEGSSWAAMKETHVFESTQFGHVR